MDIPLPPPLLSDDPVEKRAEVKQEAESHAEVKQEACGAAASNMEPPPPPPLAIDMVEVLARLRELLPSVDFASTSEKMLRKRLEDEFQIDLTIHKASIREEVSLLHGKISLSLHSPLPQIQAYLDSHPVEEADEEEGEEEEEAVAPKKKRKSGGGGTFNKEKLLSPALAALIGSERDSRPQVVKKIWDYIKANNLQNPKDKRKIILDEKLKTIFPRPVNMFSMNKYIGKHIIEEEECYEEGAAEGEEDEKKSSKPRKAAKKKASKNNEEDDDDEDDDDDDDEDYKGSSKKRRKSSGGGSSGTNNNNFTRPLKLSSTLADLVGASEMSRPSLTKWLNAYYKEHNLHDPSNKQRIISNNVLRELFQVDSFKAFGEPMKLLKPHLSKIE
jgi:upstream activation factor subunit UAF30